VRVAGNTGTGGGGLRTSYGSVMVLNSVFSDNHATLDGGGIQLYHTESVLRNLLLTGNWTELKAGGLSFDGCSPTLESLTLVGNRSPVGRGGGIGVSYASSPVMKNCILWSNVPEQIVFDRQWYGMGLTVDHCDIQGGQSAIVTFGLGTVTWGEGNLDTAPRFAGAGDYSLAADSPCVDAGLNQLWMLEERDLSGNARIVNDTVDMGAFEFGVAASERSWITRIGFSNDPEGDQDVTEFYTNETFYIRLEDVDIVGGTPANRAMAGIQQRQQRKLVKEQINLTVDANGAFVGSVPLARFKPGPADIYLYGFSQGKNLVRISKINIH
jgi:hypothetical protein